MRFVFLVLNCFFLLRRYHAGQIRSNLCCGMFPEEKIDPVLHEAAEMRLKISVCSRYDVSKSLVSYQ